MTVTIYQGLVTNLEQLGQETCTIGRWLPQLEAEQFLLEVTSWLQISARKEKHRLSLQNVKIMQKMFFSLFQS